LPPTKLRVLERHTRAARTTAAMVNTPTSNPDDRARRAAARTGSRRETSTPAGRFHLEPRQRNNCAKDKFSTPQGHPRRRSDSDHQGSLHIDCRQHRLLRRVHGQRPRQLRPWPSRRRPHEPMPDRPRRPVAMNSRRSRAVTTTMHIYICMATATISGYGHGHDQEQWPQRRRRRRPCIRASAIEVDNLVG